MQHMTRLVLSGLLITAALVVATGIAAGQSARQATQSDARGSVTIKAVYVTAAYFKTSPNDLLAGKVDLEQNVVFAITLDTHSGDLSRYDFVRNATLRNDRGQQVAPLRWVATADGSHHRSGGLAFPKIDQAGRAIDAQARTLELVVRDLGGIPERTLRWTLPIE